MAFDLSGLVQNISSSVSDFFSPRDPGANLYPSTGALAQVLAQLPITKGNWKKSFPYTFSIQTQDAASNPIQSAIATAVFADFTLPISPSDLQQDESFSIIVRPTQGGTVVQHSGNRYMDLSISGTTGNAPFKGAGGTDASGQAILQPTDMKHQSGYYVFLQLRNWFRAYYEYKKLHKQDAAAMRLVFKNFKDGEFLIVELLRFTTKRSASKPFMYDYTMNFKVLGRVQQKPKALSFLQKVDATINTAMDYINTARGVALRSQDLLRQVESNVEASILEPLRAVNLALKALAGVPVVAGDMGNRLISRLTTAAVAFAVLTHIKNSQTQAAQGAGTASGSSESQIPNKSKGPTSFVQGSGNNGFGFFGPTPTFFQGGPFNGVQLPSNITLAVQNNPTALITGLNDALMNVPISLFPKAASTQVALDQQTATSQPRSYFEDILTNLTAVRDNIADKYNLTSTTYNDHFRRTTTVAADANTTVTDDQFLLLGAMNLAIKGIYLLLSTQVMFNTTYEERIKTVQADFDNKLSIQTSRAVKEIRLPVSTTLERLAQQYLGDWSRWPELVELNDLKPPYIVQDTSDTTEGTLHPGDKMLIPAPIVNGFGNVTTLQETTLNKDLSEAEKSLGIDLLLDRNFDLVLTNSNDLLTVAGAKNAAQAILLKLFYERGDLLNNPEIGVGINVGSKGDPVSEIKSNIITSLTADPRFDSVKNLSIKREGNVMTVSFQAYIKNIDIPVPISLSL